MDEMVRVYTCTKAKKQIKAKSTGTQNSQTMDHTLR